METTIFDMLAAFINQRPGFDPANYGDYAGYRADYRVTQKDRETAHALLNNWFFRAYVKPAQLKSYLEQSSGRLTLKNGKLDYCAGQYWCLEYRRAVVQALVSCLWEALREEYYANHASYNGARDYIEAQMKRALPPWLYRRIK